MNVVGDFVLVDISIKGILCKRVEIDTPNLGWHKSYGSHRLNLLEPSAKVPESNGGD